MKANWKMLLNKKISAIKKITNIKSCCIGLLLFSLIQGCGQTPEQKVLAEVDHAQQLITSKSCGEAVDILTRNGVQKTNARYLRTLAQAYACLADFSAVRFFADDISKLDFGNSGLKGLAKFSTTSSLKSTDNLDTDKMKYMQKAIETLLYVGDLKETSDLSVESRAQYFNVSDFKKINQMLAYLSITQIGNYLKIYSNSDHQGNKGQGSGSNLCFSNYNLLPPEIQDEVETSQTGVCVDTDGYSHPDLVLSDSSTKSDLAVKNLCYGMVTFNLAITYLESVIDEIDDQTLKDSIQDIKNFRDNNSELLTFFPNWIDYTSLYSVYSCVNHVDFNPRFFQLFSLFYWEKNFK